MSETCKVTVKNQVTAFFWTQVLPKDYFPTSVTIYSITTRTILL